MGKHKIPHFRTFAISLFRYFAVSRFRVIGLRDIRSFAFSHFHSFVDRVVAASRTREATRHISIAIAGLCGHCRSSWINRLVGGSIESEV